MLDELGAKSFSFDLSEFAGGDYEFFLFIEDYVRGERRGQTIRQEIMLEIPQEYLQEIPEEYLEEFLQNFEKKNISVLIIQQTDNMARIKTMYPLGASARAVPLHTLEGTQKANYGVLPLQMEAQIAPNVRRIPLLLYGSFWPFEENNPMSGSAFCFGVGPEDGGTCIPLEELTPDFSGSALKRIPQFYVIGVEVVKRNK